MLEIQNRHADKVSYILCILKPYVPYGIKRCRIGYSLFVKRQTITVDYQQYQHDRPKGIQNSFMTNI